MIRAFGILNENYPPASPAYGVPFPGTYIVDARGRVKAKYFKADYRERETAGTIAVREFGGPGDNPQLEIRTRHLTVRPSASNRTVFPGARVTLVLEIALGPKMHVYAPGVDQQYKAVDWRMAASPGWAADAVVYPAGRTMELKAIGERVPVYEKALRLTREVNVGQNAELKAVVDGGQITLEGSFRYQACDDKVCYVPQSVPLAWRLPVSALDSERVPAELRNPRLP